MKKLLLSICCLTTFYAAQAQLQTDNRPINFGSNTYSKTTPLSKGVATCSNDTVEYTLAKATGLQLLNINNATSAQAVSQYFNAPQAITVHGVTFYAYKQDATGGITLNATVELYLAGPDSMPTGAAIATGTVVIDTAFGGGDLSVLEKNFSFSSPVIVSQPYVIVVGNYSASPMSMVFNNWSAVPGDGAQEWLAGVDLFGSWTRPYDVNVGGSIFDADVIISPHVSYDLTSDFTPNRTIFNSNPDTIIFTDNSSLVLKDRMYNQAAFIGTPKLSYTYDFGDGSPAVNAIDTNHIFAATQNYSVTLSDTIYGWRTNCIAQETKMISMPSVANLVITEIMYNPPEPGTDYNEFIEIYNNDSIAVDLTNYTSKGGDYTFPNTILNPGEYYIIAVDSIEFNDAFGFFPDGRFNNGLNNTGEFITLKDAFGNLVDSVFYDDVAPWPTGTGITNPKGGGPSIILCDVNADNNDGSNWSVSHVFAGSYTIGAGGPYDIYGTPGTANFCCPVIATTDIRTACDSLVWIDGITYYTDNNTATHITQTAQGCDSTVTLNLTVTPSPSNQTVSASQTTVCPGGGGTNIELASSETDVKYYLRNDFNDAIVAGPVMGTGTGISLYTGNVTTTTTYNVYAESATPGALSFTGNPGLKKVSLGTNLYTDNIAGTSQLTIEAWVKRSSLGSLHTIFSNYNGSFPLLFRIDSDKLNFYVNSSANVQSTNTIPAGVWTHVAATYNGSQIMVYINGVLEGSQPYSLPFISSSNELKIGGGLTNNTEYFPGDIADVRIWDHARSAIQISNNMNEVLIGSESGLIANYQFYEGSGSSTANSAVSGLYPGTLINNPSWVTAPPTLVTNNCSQEMAQLVTISVEDVTAPVPDIANLPDITTECVVSSLTTPTATDDCSGKTSLTILPPTSIAGVNTNVGVASFGSQTFNISGQLVIAQDITPDSLCCDTIVNDYTGKIAVIYRGVCSFPTKIKNAQDAGAIGVIIVNNAAGSMTFNMVGVDPSIIIPSFMISNDDGLALMNEINLGNVDVIMKRSNPITITHNATLPITSPGTTMVTWTYDDGNGNTSTQNQNVIIPSIDNTIDNSSSPTLTANQTGASYKWIDCGNGNAYIVGDTAQSFTATVNGDYAVEITVGPCVDTSACESVSTVGIKQNLTSAVSIYPNPTSGLVNINLGNNTSVVNYTVTTIEGRIVESGKIGNNIITVDLSKESKGMYFVNINIDNNTNVFKILKQ